MSGPTTDMITCSSCGTPFWRRVGRPGPAPKCDACRPAAQRPRSTERHVIAAITFQGHAGPSGTAPLECSCSWVGTVDGWFEHRREAGLATKMLPALAPIIAVDSRPESIHGGPQKQRRNPPGARFQ